MRPVQTRHGTVWSRQETDEAMFVSANQLLMFIIGGGRAESAHRTVAKLTACHNLATLPHQRPVPAGAVMGRVCEQRP